MVGLPQAAVRMISKLRSPLVIVFFTLLLDKLGENIVYPLLPFILEKFSPDGLTLGLLASTATLFSVLASPIIGSLSDAYGRRPVILLCVAINSLSLFMFGLAGTLGLIFLSRAINGVSTATIGTAQAYISDISTPANRARNFGISGAAFGLGAIAGPALGGALVGFGMRLPVFVAASLAAANFLMAFLYLKETLTRANKSSFHWSQINGLAPVMELLAMPRANRVALSFSCFNFAFSGFTTLLVLFLKDHFDWSATQSSGIFVLVGLTVTYVQVALIGPLVSRHGEARLNVYGLVAVAIGITLIPLSRGFGAAAAVVIVSAAIMLSVGAACVIPTARSLVSRLVPENRQGVMLGSLLAMTGIASALGPMVGGVLYDVSPALCFLLQGLVCLLGVPLLLKMKDPSLPVGSGAS